jgi:Transposase DDE domain
MDTPSWNETTGEPRVWKLTSAVRRKAGGKGPSYRYLACCLSYYDLGEPLPDHSSLTKIRNRYGVEIFRRLFDAVVQQCQQEKLVWGKELYIDSTQVNANADLDSLTPRFAVEARAAIQAHLAALFAHEDVGQEQQTTSADETDAPQIEATAPVAIGSAPLPLPVVLPEVEQEELASENAARHDWIAEEGRQQREVHGLYQRTSDFKVSTTDPDATPMRLKGGGAYLGYHTHYVVDGGKARIILQVLVTPSEVMDNQPMRDLIFHTRFRWKLRPRHVTGDTKYGTIENIKALEDAGIRAYVPLPDWEERYEVWSASHFRYEPQADQYRCPQGQILQRVGGSIPTGVSSIALLLPSAMTAQSKCSVRPVTRGVASIVMLERSM